jgi:hypothetical protein
MAKRPFWRRFMREVHALLVMGGALSAEGILGGLDAELDAATGRFQRITPGLLRWKLRQLIAERRPFADLPDGRFAVLAGEVPWDGESPVGAGPRGPDDAPRPRLAASGVDAARRPTGPVTVRSKTSVPGRRSENGLAVAGVCADSAVVARARPIQLRGCGVVVPPTFRFRGGDVGRPLRWRRNR